MSDRVSYAVGNTIHRDHIYWPTILESEIPNLSGPPNPALYESIWPKRISLDQITALAWRVKTWRLSGSCEATKTFNAGAFTASGTAELEDTDLFILKFEGGEEVPITREQEILHKVFTFGYLSSAFTVLGNDGIGPTSANPVVSNWETTSTLNGDFTGSLELEGTPQIFTTWPVLYESPSLFFPPCFGLGILIPAEGADNQLIVRVDFRRNPQEVLSGPIELLAPATMTVIPGIFPSFDIPMQIGWRFQSDIAGGNGSASGAFTLEATEFWPYDGTWDAGTGAQILDPFR